MTRIMENKLNMVTGGDFEQAAFDSEALHFKGYMDEDFGDYEMLFNWLNDSAKVDAGWAKAGITCVTRPFDDNRYYKDGKRISHRTAMRVIGVIK